MELKNSIVKKVELSFYQFPPVKIFFHQLKFLKQKVVILEAGFFHSV